MKRIGLCLSVVVAICGGPLRAATTSPSASPTGGWKLVFADEFDRNDLDRTRWTAYEDCWGGGNKERQCYTARPENVSVHDGQLELTARFETASGPSLPLDLRTAGMEPPPASKPFTSGKISTLGSFSLTYGRIEVRAKAPVGQGLWPAIWLLPEKNAYGPWPGSGEIDVMEAVNLGVSCSSCFGGVENNIYGTVHYGSDMHHQMQQKAAQLPKGSEGDWHVYRVDWTPDLISWFVDGKAYYQVRLSNWRDTLQKATPLAPAVRNAPFDRPFYIILNLAVGWLWPESHDQGGVVLRDFPKTLAVDWVRVSQCDGVIDRAGTCVAP